MVVIDVQTSTDETRSIIVVMCGMEMPIKFVMATYEKLKSRTSKQAKSTDFAKTMAGINTENNSYNFNGLNTTMTTSSNFLNKINSNKNTNTNPTNASVDTNNITKY